jgi:hypothetical protein
VERTSQFNEPASCILVRLISGFVHVHYFCILALRLDWLEGRF